MLKSLISRVLLVLGALSAIAFGSGVVERTLSPSDSKILAEGGRPCPEAKGKDSRA